MPRRSGGSIGRTGADRGAGVRRWMGVWTALYAAVLLAGAPPGAAAQAAGDDLTTVDGIVTALYASISGGVGVPRDEERFLSLFAPDARLVPTNPRAPAGYIALTPEGYWERSMASLVAMGFTEAEIARTTERFGNVTHVFSTYVSFREDQGDPDVPFARGINSIQLVHHQGRYWVLTVFWDSERPGNPIPARYLPGGSSRPGGDG